MLNCIESTDDAHIILESVRRGQMSKLLRRLNLKDSHGKITSGVLFALTNRRAGSNVGLMVSA